MATTLQQIRLDLQTRLEEIAGIVVYEKEVERPAVPAVIVGMPRGIDYNTTLGPTHADYEIPVLLLVGRADLIVGQEALDPYLAPTGTTAIKQAVEDSTVAVTTSWMVNVSGVEDIGTYEVAGQEYLGATFIVEVTA